MRKTLGVGATALWGLAMTVAIEKGWLDSIPDIIVWVGLCLPLTTWACIGLTHDNFRKYVRRTNRRIALPMFILIGAVIGGMIGWGVHALQTRSVRIAEAGTHDETANAWEIMIAIRNADPLEKEAKAKRYLGGFIDWNVGWFEVREIRGDSENFEAVFTPTINLPPTHPFIVCVLSKKTHGYIANIRRQLNVPSPVFHIKGVLTEINYETEFGPIKVGGPNLIVERAAAGEETTALTNDQLAAKAERAKLKQSPSQSPTPPL